jgi:tetratricopeptide (TPR) repeat protein
VPAPRGKLDGQRHIKLEIVCLESLKRKFRINPLIKILPQDQAVRLVAIADPREFSVFLGAGASLSSGVPLASEMIEEWRQMAFREQAPPGAERSAWCKAQPWFESETEYSELFEALYPDERARQKYVEPKVENAFPGWGYLYLANIIKAGHFNVVFTTNFDDLLSEGLAQYASYRAVVCAADSEVTTINASTARPKIIKLHGDYLFKRLKNTVRELEALDPNMQRKFREFAQQCGMLVLGYAGRDHSVMHVLEEVLGSDDTFPTGIYWGVHNAAEARPAVLDKLAAQYPGRLRLFECKDFDVFMARLYEELGLGEPASILEPVKKARESFDRLIKQTSSSARENATISQHLEHLREQLEGPIAQATDTAVLDLFEAQIALGHRDYTTALARIGKYMAVKPRDEKALTVFGLAQAIKGEEEGSEALVDEAAANWREALKIDPQYVPARYQLARLYATSGQRRQAISECEALLALVPKDLNLRRNLAELYLASGRLEDALHTVDWLLARDPNRSELRQMRGAVLEQQGLVTDAVAEFEQAARLAPADPWTHMALAAGWSNLGKQQEASAEYLQAIQLEPQNPNFRLRAAIFFCNVNAPFQALPHLEEAVKLAPQSAEVRGWLASAYAMAGRLPDALRECREAVQLNPRDARILGTAGQILAMANQPDQAERYLRQAIEQNPTFVNPYVVLARLYWMGGRVQQYQETVQRLAQVSPEAARMMVQQFSAIGQPVVPAPSAAAGHAGGGTAAWLRDWTKLFSR